MRRTQAAYSGDQQHSGNLVLSGLAAVTRLDTGRVYLRADLSVWHAQHPEV
jgi:hypothetical protein